MSDEEPKAVTLNKGKITEAELAIQRKAERPGDENKDQKMLAGDKGRPIGKIHPVGDPTWPSRNSFDNVVRSIEERDNEDR